jgi:hypothetical protein
MLDDSDDFIRLAGRRHTSQASAEGLFRQEYSNST